MTLRALNIQKYDIDIKDYSRGAGIKLS